MFFSEALNRRLYSMSLNKTDLNQANDKRFNSYKFCGGDPALLKGAESPLEYATSNTSHFKLNNFSPHINLQKTVHCTLDDRMVKMRRKES